MHRFPLKDNSGSGLKDFGYNHEWSQNNANWTVINIMKLFFLQLFSGIPWTLTFLWKIQLKSKRVFNMESVWGVIPAIQKDCYIMMQASVYSSTDDGSYIILMQRWMPRWYNTSPETSQLLWNDKLIVQKDMWVKRFQELKNICTSRYIETDVHCCMGDNMKWWLQWFVKNRL